MMNFKRDTSQPARHAIQFKLVDRSGSAVTLARVLGNDEKLNTRIVSDDKNLKIITETIEKSIEKFGLNVKPKCETIITVIYYERNFKVISAKTTIVNHLKTEGIK